jgi:hypothetical protein
MGRFFPVYIHSWLSGQFSGSQAGYGTTFRSTGGYQKAGTSSLRGLLEGSLQLVSDFIGARRNIDLDFLHKKTTKKFENHQRSFNFRTFKNINLVTLTL